MALSKFYIEEIHNLFASLNKWCLSRWPRNVESRKRKKKHKIWWSTREVGT